eukprot:COSAG02_NODE_3993_length_5942_cov_2.729249_2_plen_113_part_00
MGSGRPISASPHSFLWGVAVLLLLPRDPVCAMESVATSLFGEELELAAGANRVTFPLCNPTKIPVSVSARWFVSVLFPCLCTVSPTVGPAPVVDMPARGVSLATPCSCCTSR